MEEVNTKRNSIGEGREEGRDTNSMFEGFMMKDKVKEDLDK